MRNKSIDGGATLWNMDGILHIIAERVGVYKVSRPSSLGPRSISMSLIVKATSSNATWEDCLIWRFPSSATRVSTLTRSATSPSKPSKSVKRFVHISAHPRVIPASDGHGSKGNICAILDTVPGCVPRVWYKVVDVSMW